MWIVSVFSYNGKALTNLCACQNSLKWTRLYTVYLALFMNNFCCIARYCTEYLVLIFIFDSYNQMMKTHCQMRVDFFQPFASLLKESDHGNTLSCHRNFVCICRIGRLLMNQLILLQSPLQQLQYQL